jgi:hypothetical protein
MATITKIENKNSASNGYDTFTVQVRTKNGTLSSYSFPPEITLKIFWYLQAHDLEAVRNVNHSWRILASDKNLLRNLTFQAGFISWVHDSDEPPREFYKGKRKRENESLIDKITQILYGIDSYTIEKALDKEEKLFAELEREKINAKKIKSIKKKRTLLGTPFEKTKPGQLLSSKDKYIEKLSKLKINSKNEEDFSKEKIIRKKLNKNEVEFDKEKLSYQEKLSKFKRKLEKIECEDEGEGGKWREWAQAAKDLQKLRQIEDTQRKPLIKEFDKISLLSKDKEVEMFQLLEKAVTCLIEKTSSPQSLMKKSFTLIKEAFEHFISFQDPSLKGQLRFLIVSQACSVYFLQELFGEGKVQYPTQKVCEKFSLENPFSYAIKERDFNMVAMLLKLGMEPSSSDLTIAIKHLDIEIIKLLLQTKPVIDCNHLKSVIPVPKDLPTDFGDLRKVKMKREIMELLCDALAISKKVPVGWEESKNSIVELALKLDADLPNQIAIKQAQIDAIVQSEAEWSLTSNDERLSYTNFEEYRDRHALVLVCYKEVLEFLKIQLKNNNRSLLIAAGLLPEFSTDIDKG